MQIIKRRRRRSNINIKRLLRHRSRAVAINIVIISLGLIFLMLVTNLLFNNNKNVKINVQNLASFQIPPSTIIDLSNLSTENNISFNESLTLFMFENNFFANKTVPFSTDQLQQSFFDKYDQIKKRYGASSVNEVLKIYNAVLSDIKYFPIPENYSSGTDSVYMYGDSWGNVRTYGGERTHEGADIFDRDNIRGRITIVSMTSGVVENLGWNEKGGWRVGIRSDNNVYYYYAHLDKYSQALAEGKRIGAGSVIGSMGDTGYSKKAGTKGNFPVHLHVGISITTPLSKKELWINPYPLLRLYEINKITI